MSEEKQFEKEWWKELKEDCKQCKKSCKQSAKVQVSCPKFESKTWYNISLLIIKIIRRGNKNAKFLYESKNWRFFGNRKKV